MEAVCGEYVGVVSGFSSDPLPPIAGIVGVSLVDYPGKVAAVLFLRGCSFRCPYCYNKALVLPQCYRDTPVLDGEMVLAKVQKRSSFLDAVVVTGGEPTVHPVLPSLLGCLKAMGLAVKLDTNGSNPSMLHFLVGKGLVDMVAMDVKAPPMLYPQVTGGVAWPIVEPSVKFLLESEVSYEFRTTLVPGLVEGKDVLEIAKVIRGAQVYAIQNFRPENTIDSSLEECYPFGRLELETVAQEIAPLVRRVVVRYGA